MFHMQIKKEKSEEEPQLGYQQQQQRNNFGYRQEVNVKGQKMPPPPPLRQRPAQQSTSLNRIKQQQQQQHVQQRAPGAGGAEHWASNSNYMRRQGRTAAVQPPGVHCGEIFVANNARQWTFVCTFCNKSTRDIGDFICHIKIKHLQEYTEYDDDDDYEGADESMEGAYDADAYEQDQDYLDCSGYLAVNMHTEEAAELNYSSPEQQLAKKSKSTQQMRQPAVVAPTPQKSQQNRSYEQHSQPVRGNGAAVHHAAVETLADDDDDDAADEALETSAAATTSRSNKAAKKSTANAVAKFHKQPAATTHTNGTFRQLNVEDYEQFESGDMDAQNDFAGYRDDDDDDDDDDYDNKLLLAPNDALLDASASSTAGSNDGESKGKRRQIRGTAYCALCNKTFQYYSLYRNHMIKHSNDTPFKCPLCKKGFKSKQAIRYHMNTHQKEKRFKCPLCHAGYYTENQFITHVLTHENESTFPCMVCGKILRSDKERDVHLTTHTEERPFRCEFCNKLFRLRHHLSNHLKMHRQYRCDYCKGDFTSAVYLRKPYACTECEKLPDVQAHVAANRAVPSGGRGSAGNRASVASAASVEADVNPLQLFDALGVPLQPTECVDLAEMVSDSEGEPEVAEDPEGDAEVDEDEEEESNYVLPTQRSNTAAQATHKERFNCKHCHRSYSHISGLNYHIRHKHR